MTLLHYFFDSTSILLVFGRFEDSKRTFRNKSTFLSNRINLKSRTLRMNQGCISLKLLNCKKSTKMNVLPTNLMKSWKKCTNRRSKSFKKGKKILKDFKKCPFFVAKIYKYFCPYFAHNIWKKSLLFQHGLLIILSINVKAFVCSIIDSTINELFFVYQWNLFLFKTCLLS